MLYTYQQLKRRRDAGEIDGFTLIELLIVIVVLGILAAVVIFALGGITGKSAVAACQADGATVATAISALNAQYPGALSAAGAGSNETALLLQTTTDGGPYISSWPSNPGHYAFGLLNGTLGLEMSGPATGSVYAPLAFAAATLTGTVPAGSAFAGASSSFVASVGVASGSAASGTGGGAYNGPGSCVGVH